jgi:Raf kinase inhibitor-like YbhB/YbcL family protein
VGRGGCIAAAREGLTVPRVRRGAVPAVAALGLALAGCGGSHSGSTTASPPTAPRTIRVTSPAFAAGGTIPHAYTCDGADTPLPLRWSGVPAAAQSLTLTMRDPDAPGGTFIHWSVSHIPPSTTHIGGTASSPPDAIAARNSFGVAGYRGPCPPHGDRPHRYVITLTAAGTGGEPVATGQLVGRYGR